jgi:hypothetical protein
MHGMNIKNSLRHFQHSPVKGQILLPPTAVFLCMVQTTHKKGNSFVPAFTSSSVILRVKKEVGVQSVVRLTATGNV